MPEGIIPVRVKPEPINNAKLVESFTAEGGRIMHIRPEGWNGKRGVTFAYKRKNGRIEFSTAVTHKTDDFTKKIGTKLAIEHFQAGKTVVLPVRSDRIRAFFECTVIYN